MKIGLKCKNCGECIFSYHRHDYKECSCGECFVDGGNEYFRRGTDQIPPQYVKYNNKLDITVLVYSEVFGFFGYLKKGGIVIISENGDVDVETGCDFDAFVKKCKLRVVDVYYSPDRVYTVFY